MADVRRLSGGCREAVLRVYGSCLEFVGRLSGGFRRLSARCGEALWRLCGGCLEGVGKLSGGSGEAVWRM